MSRKKKEEKGIEIGELNELLNERLGELSRVGEEELREMVMGMSEEMKQANLVIAARALDNAEGYEAFYRLVFGRVLPRHAKRWIEGIYEARKEGKGCLIRAFRGSTKTTTITIGFTAWRIGREPERANLLIQVGDDIAVDNTAQVANLIKFNPGFRAIFPHIVPDEELGWGASGYQVKRDDIDYHEWRERNARRKDPTLVGVGINSKEIIGKHPDGVLVIDDIHDEGNTSSEKMLNTVRRALTANVFPAAVPETWKIAVGTPWVENDMYAYIESTGEYISIKTPVVDEGGDPVWPSRYGEKEIEIQKNMAGSIEYARMFLLDLSRMKNKVFKYQSYPNSEIKSFWPMSGGVDYAGTDDPFKNKLGLGNYFALAYVAKLPGGGAVVVDGVLERCTQGESEFYVKKAQNLWPGWMYAVVEGDGIGQEFIQVLRRNPGLKILPMRTHKRGKNERLMIEMGPWFENGTVRVSDADTPFLNELRKELDTWPLSANDDALDAVYWALRGMPDVLKMPRADKELPRAQREEPIKNPFLGLNGRRNRHGTRA